MPGKFTDGYTKDAQKAKFVRNRDIKMKDTELKKEAKIQKLMCEGVCKRCREKVQWKFNFDKYKPLKNPATCQQCKQKTVTKAYRTLCDRCAASRNVCPGCCEDVLDLEQAKAPSNATTASQDIKQTEDGDEDENGMVWGQHVDDGEVKEEEDDDNNEEEEEEDEPEKEYGMDIAWHEKKFQNIAASKYTKHRPTGMEGDLY
jgi:TATA-binding protein-associated factor Taf7